MVQRRRLHHRDFCDLQRFEASGLAALHRRCFRDEIHAEPSHALLRELIQEWRTIGHAEHNRRFARIGNGLTITICGDAPRGRKIPLRHVLDVEYEYGFLRELAICAQEIAYTTQAGAVMSGADDKSQGPFEAILWF